MVRVVKREEAGAVGTSGGYLWHILKTKQAQHAGSQIKTQRGRNNDVSEYSVVDAYGQNVFKAARYYGFRNIQNLVRRTFGLVQTPKPPDVADAVAIALTHLYREGIASFNDRLRSAR